MSSGRRPLGTRRKRCAVSPRVSTASVSWSRARVRVYPPGPEFPTAPRCGEPVRRSGCSRARAVGTLRAGPESEQSALTRRLLESEVTPSVAPCPLRLRSNPDTSARARWHRRPHLARRSTIAPRGHRAATARTRRTRRRFSSDRTDARTDCIEAEEALRISPSRRRRRDRALAEFGCCHTPHMQAAGRSRQGLPAGHAPRAGAHSGHGLPHHVPVRLVAEPPFEGNRALLHQHAFAISRPMTAVARGLHPRRLPARVRQVEDRALRW